ncbi:hypothetical protein CN059_08435 [Sinorhizobium medicae]|uniref:hypothetical protein n=1 Tax=Sinorhizobium medicae TaxID=110321 RepID=UPI000FD81BB6|nr:hypothetical protein [Sinorhizobium medicae]MDX0623483.1 hypothetical protein [Sinorhizobium medicae]RVQ49511.1 hypothetical protein CN059_08435 [Sinorhizobium medicae]
MSRTQFFKRVKGHVSQYEDWYYLVEEDDGKKYVEHEWDHVTVNGLSQNVGTKRYTVEEFLGGDHFTGAQVALQKLLG